MKTAMKVTMDEAMTSLGEIPMSYAEAKEIALLRLELRACYERADRVAGRHALVRFAQIAANDNELCAEARRWATRFDAA